MIVIVNGVDVEVRACRESDVPLLLEFFRSLAAFEKLAISATEDSVRTALFGEAPAAHALLAFAEGRPIGYAVYFFNFSTMIGKRGLWLEDLYIEPAFRRRGIGQALMSYLAEIAAKNECGRFEWSVLEWNQSAIRFYEQLGANLLKDWWICRLDEAGLRQVASKLRLANADE
jgi:GNAT superfamily N-acetyltransferase